jgi:endonuclease/exonuclease/phosphatase family metal-dependent hydrolase
VVLAIVAATGCVSVDVPAGPWEPAEAITGELAPEIGPPPPASAPRARLRLVSWNVHFGERVDELAANIRASALADADLWFLQEIENRPGEVGTRARRLAEALGLTWAYAPARTTDDGGTHGIALMSRYPLEQIAIKKLPFIDQPFRARTRNAMSAVLVVGEHRLRVVNVHLDVRLGAADRILQLDPAVVDLEGAGDEHAPAIVAGDFNTNPWAWVEATVPLTGTEAIVGMEQAVLVDDYMTGLGFVGAISKDTATVRLPGLAVRADNLYARDIALAVAGLEEVDGSDHWPVWIDVDL